MNIELLKTATGAILYLNGRLESTSAPEAQEALMSLLDEYQNITLDFSGLLYISSAGLRVLLTLQKKSNANGYTIKLDNVKHEIMEIFEMTGFSGILTFA
ncbi:MAG: STAS domain-containing protein [Oscillospiraceae bacterium]|nr:STAS domain-containing protein [Oscillospiraceae bacterium]